jgi:4-diphosphocytidyl-2-C-methyl-D-erythritol kinase
MGVGARRTSIASVSGTPSVITVRVPAKINIYLGVGSLRPDGFHELDTVFHAVGLYDTVTAAASDGLSLVLGGPESAGLPTDESNLAWRAATLLAAYAGIEPRVALNVEKSIPVAAGLAGGSADAAGALVACARLWNLPVPRDELSELAAQLGSDVPFALLGGTAHGTGRGERLHPVAGVGAYHWVLAAADEGLSTPAVYRELDRQRAAGTAPAPLTGSSELLAALSTTRPDDLAPHLANDLEPAAARLAPGLDVTSEAGLRAGALAGIVSGSGPTFAFLAEDAEHAERVAYELTASQVCRFASAVPGGVSGAEVVG